MISISAPRRLCVLMLSVSALLSTAVAQSDSDAKPDAVPAANPGRPTLSTPATLTPIGYLQFESGTLGAIDSGEFANRVSLNEVIKLTLTRRLQFITQTEPMVGADLGAQHSSSPGGVALGMQAMLLPGKGTRPTISVSYFRSVYGGSAPDLDIGSSRNSAVMLFSADLGRFHVDTNYIFNEQLNLAVHRAQFGQTLSISHPMTKRTTFTTELWHYTQPFLHGHAAGLLVTPTFTPRPNIVLDAGFSRGLTDSSTHWQVFAGITYLLPRKLWK